MDELELRRYQESSFDAFCKKVIKTSRADYYRLHRRDYIPESVVTDCLMDSQLPFTGDTGFSYNKIYYVQDLPVVIRDENIGDALQFIVPKKRDVLLLSFFLEYKDSEIARYLGLSCPTVARRKDAALDQLRTLLEVKKNVG